MALPARTVHDPACQIWTGPTNACGYGRSSVRGVNGYAHRRAYEEAVGPIPEGHDLDHLCRNRACVNPAHLEPVTRAENIRRGAATKLTVDDVIRIRVRGERVSALARELGVNRQTVYDIRNRRTWKDIA